jgi:integrase
LTYCDIIALMWDNIERDNHGELWINYRREKTESSTLVPLLGPALVILEKRKSNQIVPGPNVVFTWVSNQCVNKSLKIIAAVCGIRKHLTFHVARHTFATTITLMNDIPIETISKMLGHTKISTTMLYAKVTQLKIDRDIRMLREKIGFGQQVKN